MPSTAIRDFRYDPAARRLYVWFVSGGDYVYFDVPPRVYGGFLAAESKGRYFHEAVLDRYRYERLN